AIYKDRSVEIVEGVDSELRIGARIGREGPDDRRARRDVGQDDIELHFRRLTRDVAAHLQKSSGAADSQRRWSSVDRWDVARHGCAGNGNRRGRGTGRDDETNAREVLRRIWTLRARDDAETRQREPNPYPATVEHGSGRYLRTGRRGRVQSSGFRVQGSAFR